MSYGTMNCLALAYAYSGVLTNASDLPQNGISKPPVLLVHGTADPVVPVAALHMSESELRRLGVPVKTHVSYGVGHSVDPEGLRLGAEFIAQAFASTR